jgi:hypothetical protein
MPTISQFKTRARKAGGKSQKPVSDRVKKRDFIIIFLTALSAIGAVLTLVGYGVSVSVKELNLSNETVFASPFELLELSQWAVIRVLSKLSSSELWVFYKTAIASTLPGILIATLVLTFFVFFVKSPAKVMVVKKHATSFFRYFFVIEKSDNFLVSLRKLYAYMVTLGMVLPLVYLLVVFSFFAGSAFLITLPALGMFAGEGHIVEDVVKPSSCYPKITRENFLSIKKGKKSNASIYAECVQLSTEKGMAERGRVVFATSSAIILYEPVTGTVKRIPIRDVTVEVIDQL